MKPQEISEKLRLILESGFASEESIDPLPENRIFVNRNLKLSRIRAVGFDMDFTLAQYKQAALDEATYYLTLKTLVEEYKYPESILKLPYDHDFTIRGLVMDTALGNVLKMDKFKYTSLGYHGLRLLKPDQRRQQYRHERITFGNDRYRVVDTLFELVETYLFAALIDHLEKPGEPPLDYKKLFQDIRASVDLKHRDGTLKGLIMANPAKFIHDDPLLIPTLHKFKTHGKRLFVVTNSEAHYTQFMLDYLFRHASPFFRSWQKCFELVVTESQKPRFFGEGRPVQVVSTQDCHFVTGGNLAYVES
ncbi:MAG: HAD-IG family 5'-nucleotidase, partial [Acidobacteria bacterium]|nr:HAD-IG family 5'-nucleotidase [Acidobacteriota bacterium]